MRQPGRSEVDLWWLVVLPWAVEADEGVEVDHAAALEFRDFHKGHPAASGEIGRGQARGPS